MIGSVSSINVYTIIYLIELGVLAHLEMGPPLESHTEAAGVEAVAAFVPVVVELVAVEPVAVEPAAVELDVVVAVAELAVVLEVQAVLEPYA